MKASICCCSWVGLLDRDSELGEVEMEIELEVALSAYALRNVNLEYRMCTCVEMSSKTKAYVLPRDAILDSQPSKVVRNIGYMLRS